jgi:hypothetical protein
MRAGPLCLSVCLWAASSRLRGAAVRVQEGEASLQPDTGGSDQAPDHPQVSLFCRILLSCDAIIFLNKDPMTDLTNHWPSDFLQWGECFGSALKPDLSFYINADQDPGIKTNAGPCGFESCCWADIAVTKSWILTWKILYTYFMYSR